MKMRTILVSSTLIATMAASQTFAAGGTLMLTEGKVLIEHNGQSFPASRGADFQSGDTLTVGPAANAQVQFEDGSVFAVPGTASFKVDAFAMPTPAGGGKAQYTLQEGGLRTITGQISKHKDDDYAMHTPEATITVEGSAYSALRCTNQCGKHKPGLYVRGEAGVITVANPGATLKLKRGQIAYVAAATSAPILVKDSPFSDPKFAASFAAEIKIEGETHLPPRVEPEPPASPS